MFNTQMSLDISHPTFKLFYDQEENRYFLTFEKSDIKVKVNLFSRSFRVMVMQGQALLSSSSDILTPPEVDASCRESAWPLRHLNDRSWRLMLRETQLDDLLLILWYLKDIGIAQGVLRNMSVRAGDEMTRMLAERFEGRIPDNLPVNDVDAIQARKALTAILSTLVRLISEGQIGEIL